MAREHHFKECVARKETGELWKSVGEASADGVVPGETRKLKGKKGFGLGIRTGRAGPGNTPVRKLLSDHRSTEAVVIFLSTKAVGRVKKGLVIGRGLGRGGTIIIAWAFPCSFCYGRYSVISVISVISLPLAVHLGGGEPRFASRCLFPFPFISFHSSPILCAVISLGFGIAR